MLKMTTFSDVPPGFRFHPTEEELVDYYLRKKVASRRIETDFIKEVDLYKIEPWDLQEKCKITAEEQNEWYFFSHKDKKYPSGTRTNRATTAGFWKATGRDKPIYLKEALIGMRKTLVFYRGRAPNGHKLDWIMHEYRLETTENGFLPQEEGWVVCRVFKKKAASTQIVKELENPPLNHWLDESLSFLPLPDSPKRPSQLYLETSHHPPLYANFKPEQEQQQQKHHFPHDHDHSFLHLQYPETLKLPHCISHDQAVTDWRVFDKLVASRLSQEDTSKESDFDNSGHDFRVTEQ